MKDGLKIRTGGVRDVQDYGPVYSDPNEQLLYNAMTKHWKDRDDIIKKYARKVSGFSEVAIEVLIKHVSVTRATGDKSEKYYWDEEPFLLLLYPEVKREGLEYKITTKYHPLV